MIVLYQCIDPDYNMVGMALTMSISTIHERACIDLLNAWKFEKDSKNYSFICCKHNDKITKV